MKEFNVEGTCFPTMHYMVDITKRLEKMETLIKNGKYFCINRGRQYGKTTTINSLCDYLKEDYSVFSITFEDVSDKSFESIEKLLAKVVYKMYESVMFDEVYNLSNQNKSLLEELAEKSEMSDNEFTFFVAKFTKNNKKPIVLIIDEVDQASNYEAFLKFLGILRAAYLKRDKRPMFSSIILASVYDVKNLKFKIPGSTGSLNSPWNIATSFDEPMEFDASGIAGMLKEYAIDHEISFDIEYMAQQIEKYTGGYPALVCRLCKKIDEEKLGWNREGLLTALRNLLKESNTLFDDLCKKIEDNPEIKNVFKQILYVGESYAFDINNRVLNLAYAFRFIKNDNGKVQIANPIFETVLYNLFLSEEEVSGRVKSVDRNQFISNGRLDIELVLEKFSQHYNDIYDTNDIKMLEADCRRIFMLYVKPIINGTGNYYIEAENRDGTRTDMVIDYLGEQFVLEMKIWRGEIYQQKGELQLADYLDKLNADRGYLVIFNFNHNKVVGRTEKIVDGKQIIEFVI